MRSQGIEALDTATTEQPQTVLAEPEASFSRWLFTASRAAIGEPRECFAAGWRAGWQAALEAMAAGAAVAAVAAQPAPGRQLPEWPERDGKGEREC